MKKNFFASILCCMAVIHTAENGYIQNKNISIEVGITIAQILATPNRFIYIGKEEKYRNAWQTLINDLISAIDKNIPKITGQFLRSIIKSGFNPDTDKISEQALVAVMFFLTSISKSLRSIEFSITNKSYVIGKLEPWFAIKQHLLFANLINQNKISCIKVNQTPVYHPMNFDKKGTPKIIQTIASTYGPFFQNVALDNELKLEHCLLIDYANPNKDIRARYGSQAKISFEFPNNYLNLYFNNNIS